VATYKYDEWRVENAQLNYPFADDVSMANETLTLPRTLFLDARLYPIGGGPRQFISRIVKAQGIITLKISDETGSVAAASYAEVAIPATGEVAIYDAYDRPAGVLVGTLTSLQAFSAIDTGIYEFTVAQTAFAATVVIPQPAFGVRGVLLASGDVMTGDVWLIGEDGIVLREEDGAIRIDAIGDPFAEQKFCIEEETAETQQLQPYCPIRTINGLTPDERGNVMLVVGGNQSLTNLLRITPRNEPGDDLTAHVGDQSKLQSAVFVIKAVGERRMRGV
jgi:hypothetical protein